MEPEIHASKMGTVLESALLDQKMRADRHRGNFESLKAQHLFLQEAHQNLKIEFDSLSKNYDKLHHESQEIIRTLQKERDDKLIQYEELKPQVLTSLKLEQLRRQLSDELEEPYKKRLALVESEQESLKSEHSKLKYDYAFLKSEHQASLVTHKSVVQELITRHEAKLSALIQDKKDLLARQERDVPTDLQRIRQLQRETSELQQKVKSLISENEELVTQKEYFEMQSEQNNQVYSRHQAELQAQIKTKELECSSLEARIQVLLSELSEAHQQQLTLSDQLTQSQRELSTYRRKFEELEHQDAMEISNLKMKHAEHCHKFEKEMKQCVLDLQAGQAQIDSLHKTLKEHQVLLADKEHDVEQRVARVREKEWEKLVVLERIKIEQEEKVAEVQRYQLQCEEDSKVKLQKLEDYVHQLQISKTELESEIETAKLQCREKDQQLQTLSAEVQHLSTISKKYQTLLVEHTSLQQSENELKDLEKKLQNKVHVLEQQLNKAHEDIQKVQEKFKEDLERERQLWCEQKLVLAGRVEECQSYQQALSGQLADANMTTKKIQKHYRKQIQELHQSVELLRAKEAEVRIEKETMRNTAEFENQKLKRKISGMQRKHKEFLFLLHHVDPCSSLTAVDPEQSFQQLWKTQEGMQKGQEELFGDTDTIASIQQQPLMLPQQNILFHGAQLPRDSPTHSEASLTDPPK